MSKISECKTNKSKINKSKIQENKIPKIGMRNIKTALGVLICLLIFKLLKRDGTPLVACVTSVIAMQDTIDNSLKSGTNRLLGSLLGSIIGLLFFIANHYFFNGTYGIFFVPLGIVTVIYICNLLRRKDSVLISCTVYLLLMITPEVVSPLVFALNRLLDTFIGATVAVIVNRFISPKIEPMQINVNELLNEAEQETVQK